MLKFHSARRAFTLIEMLVVICIISLLAALLYPVFEQVRNKANIASCTSNVKQILLAFHQYVQDNDGRLPHYGDPTKINPDGIAYVGSNDLRFAEFGWAGPPSEGPALTGNPYTFLSSDDYLWKSTEDRPLNPYIKDYGVLYCPVWGEKPVYFGTYSPRFTASQVFGNSYSINTRLIYPGGWADGRNQAGSCGASDMGYGYCPTAEKSVMMDTVLYPTFTPIIADGYMAWAGYQGLGNTTQAPGMFSHGGSDQYGTSQQIYQGTSCVYGFLDGHVKFMNPAGFLRGNFAYFDGGTVSWMDDRYKSPTWAPGTIPTSGRPY